MGVLPPMSTPPPTPPPSLATSSPPPPPPVDAEGDDDDRDCRGEDGHATMTTATSTTEAAKAKESSKKKKKGENKADKTADERSDLAFTWICAECREAECVLDPYSPLVLCDGPCDRPFHPRCANLARLPPDDSPWFCVDCTSGRHACAACGEYGRDGVDVHRCDARGCGLFYHENCLGMYEDVDVVLVEEGMPDVVMEEAGGGDGEDYDEGGDGDDDGCRVVATATKTKTNAKTKTRPKFRCPAHQCWTCSSGRPPAVRGEEAEGGALRCHPVSPVDAGGGRGGGRKRKKGGGGGGGGVAPSALWAAKKERLFRCLDCPVSYHITCMPPSCRFHELAMLCHEHAYTSKLPYLDEGYSMQASVEADVERKLRNLEREAEAEARRRAGAARPSSSDDDDDDDEEDDDGRGRGRGRGAGDNAFFPGLVGSAVTFEEERLAEFLEGENCDDDDDEGDDDDDDGDRDNVARRRRKRKKRREFNYCLPLDFKELASMNIGILPAHPGLI